MPVFAGESREALRATYRDAWRKARSGGVLTALEAQIVGVLEKHPEYHAWLESGDAVLHEDFGPERGTLNPFLHLGLHLAIRDQVATDRPAGIAQIHARLAASRGDAHAAEHAMLEVLGETLWDAQRSGRMPDERSYLERLRSLA